MFYKDRIRNLAAVYPKLAAVWIKTEDERRPLKQIWLNEGQIFAQPEQAEVFTMESESVEQSEDHLALAAQICQGSSGESQSPLLSLVFTFPNPSGDVGRSSITATTENSAARIAFYGEWRRRRFTTSRATLCNSSLTGSRAISSSAAWARNESVYSSARAALARTYSGAPLSWRAAIVPASPR